MNRSIAGRLIAKDLYLYRPLIACALVAGIASLVLSRFSAGDHVSTGVNAGVVLFMTTIIAFGIFIAMGGILKERQDRSHLFVLSLPIAPAQYARAKVGAALVAFLVPWTALTAGGVAATMASGEARGSIPFFVVMMTFFLAGFCVLTAVVVISMSETWSFVAILVTNVSVPLFLASASRWTAAAERRSDAAATWSPAVLTLLAAEIVVIALSLGLAFFLPSRRRDFI